MEKTYLNLFDAADLNELRISKEQFDVHEIKI